MRIVIEIEDGGVRSARVSSDSTASQPTGEYGVGTPGVTDVAALQLRGTNAGPAPTRGAAAAPTAAADSGDTTAAATEDYGGAQAAGPAPNA